MAATTRAESRCHSASSRSVSNLRLKWTSRNAVQIGMIYPADGAKPVQIKVRVASSRGSKRPLNEPDSAAQGFGALKEFQHAANAPVAVFAVHTGHVRMEVGHAVAKPKRPPACSRPGGRHRKRPALAGRYARPTHKHGSRLDFQSASPQISRWSSTQRWKSFETSHSRTMNLLPHCLAGAPFHLWQASASPSDFFAASQPDASICSRARSLNSRPFFRASPSMARNRRENFAVGLLECDFRVDFQKIATGLRRRRASLPAPLPLLAASVPSMLSSALPFLPHFFERRRLHLPKSSRCGKPCE